MSIVESKKTYSMDRKLDPGMNAGAKTASRRRAVNGHCCKYLWRSFWQPGSPGFFREAVLGPAFMPGWKWNKNRF